MRAFVRNCAGASAAEFALILPAALLLLFGVIDVGRYAWQLNEYEKAVQLGTRYAVATNVVSKPLKTADYSTVTCPGATNALSLGETICAEAMRTVVCTNTSCTCKTGSGVCSSASGTEYDANAFNEIVRRMAVASRRISSANVIVEYAGSGIGYYGDPSVSSDCASTSDAAECQLPDAAPTVTVKLTNLRYYPITLSLFGGASVRYPPFSYSLTMEDADGTEAS